MPKMLHIGSSSVWPRASVPERMCWRGSTTGSGSRRRRRGDAKEAQNRHRKPNKPGRRGQNWWLGSSHVMNCPPLLRVRSWFGELFGWLLHSRTQAPRMQVPRRPAVPLRQPLGMVLLPRRRDTKGPLQWKGKRLDFKPFSKVLHRCDTGQLQAHCRAQHDETWGLFVHLALRQHTFHTLTCHGMHAIVRQWPST